MLTYSYSSPRRSVTSVAATLQKKEYGTASTIQTKLTVGQPNDQYEQEADRVADQVVKSPAVGSKAQDNPGLQKNEEENAQMRPALMKAEEEDAQMKPTLMKAEEEEPQAKLQMQEEEEAQPKLQMQEEEEAQTRLQKMEEEPQAKLQKAEEEEVQAKKQTPTANVAPPSIHRKIKERKGTGSPLPSSTRSFMESRIGADFSGVRIHTDSQSQMLNTKLGAQAFAVGNNVFFNKGKYNPDSRSGKHLLAHELTHTVQQGASPRQVQKKRAWR